MRLKTKILLGFQISILLTSGAMAAGIPEKHQTDFVQIGRQSSADPAEFIFDVGDGATNPTISVDKAAKTFDLDKATRIQGDLSLGDGSSGDRSITVDEGAGSGNPYMKWDTATNKWKQFDGTTERDIGAGGGGAADAINIIAGLNPGAEDGEINWTYSGTGSFTTTSVLAERYDGEKSFVTDFDVQAETLKIVETTISEGLYGQACQARFFYIGGDSTIDITATVENGNDNQVGSQSFILKAVTVWTPNATDIGGDAQLANLYLQIEQTGVGNSASFRHDKVHLGGLIGLVEVATPDAMGAKIGSTGTVTSESADFIQGDCTNADPKVCTFVSGSFTVTPVCVASIENGTARVATIEAISNTSVSVQSYSTRYSPVEEAADSLFLICHKQGVDAKQSVTVIKHFPKVSEITNVFSAKHDGSSIISDENVDWISGNCTAANPTVCTFSANFSTIPNCVATGTQSETKAEITALSTSSISIQRLDSAGSGVLRPFTLVCHKTGDDYKTPTVQYIIPNQVETTVSKGTKTTSCRVNLVGGTPGDGNSHCASWVDSYTDTGVGDVTLNLTAGVFSDEPMCNVTTVGNAGNILSTPIVAISNSLIRVRVYDDITLSDYDFNIRCEGAR